MNKKVEGFSCQNCQYLKREYIGDGFDEFYDWKCGAEGNKAITCVDTFDPIPPLPTWCPMLKTTLEAIKLHSKSKKGKKS